MTQNNSPRPSADAIRIADSIRSLRQNAGLNHQDIATALGVSFHQYFCIETGNHIPDALLLKKISDLYTKGKGEGDEWCCATENNMNAWCNWDGMNWNAYIIKLNN